MKTIKRTDGWWVVNTPEGVEEIGPERTKAEADESRVRCDKFLKNEHNRSFFTADPLPKIVKTDVSQESLF